MVVDIKTLFLARPPLPSFDCIETQASPPQGERSTPPTTLSSSGLTRGSMLADRVMRWKWILGSSLGMTEGVLRVLSVNGGFCGAVHRITGMFGPIANKQRPDCFAGEGA
jgi:hypothetical protein